MENIFKPVERQKAKLRMALTGVSGGGKTLGALYIAYGITGDWSKIALIDTERERGRLYANRSDLDVGTFLYAPLCAPYWSEKYRDYVKQAAQAVGPEGVVIIDSLSHAWSYEGGILDLKDQIAARQGKNSYTAWNEAGKEQNGLINEIL
ncbi:MAG: AAA family ATPase, partial [Oscillospiraceae bacterium]